MAKHCNIKVQKDAALIKQTFSNLAVKRKDIMRKITNAVDKTEEGAAAQRSKKLSEVMSKGNIKEITVHLISFLGALFLIMKKFNVKMQQFQEKTEQLLKEYNFTSSVERFQDSLILYQYKIGEKDGQLGIYLGLDDTPVLLCDNVIPLLERLVKMISEIIARHISGCSKKICPVCLNKKLLKKEICQIFLFPLAPNADGSNGEEELTDKNHESDDYDEFYKKIKKKYSALKKYMGEKKLKKPKGKEKHCLIYKEQDGTIKHRFFVDKTQALNWCYKNKKSMEKDLPVILTTNRYDSSPSAHRQKKKARKAVVGREASPNVKAVLRVPWACGTSEPKLMDFFMDTGADGGSVGYDCKVLQGFVFSMEEIEDGEKPVVFGQISIKECNFEEIQSFDVDRDPAWNALGMEQIKHFDVYLSHEKEMSALINVHVDKIQSFMIVMPKYQAMTIMQVIFIFYILVIYLGFLVLFGCAACKDFSQIHPRGIIYFSVSFILEFSLILVSVALTYRLLSNSIVFFRMFLTECYSRTLSWSLKELYSRGLKHIT